MDTFVRFNCPNPVCGKRLKAPPEQAGTRTRCPSCREPILPRPARRPPARPSAWFWSGAAGGAVAVLLVIGVVVGLNRLSRAGVESAVAASPPPPVADPTRPTAEPKATARPETPAEPAQQPTPVLAPPTAPEVADPPVPAEPERPSPPPPLTPVPATPRRDWNGPWKVAEVRRVETASSEVAFAQNGRSVIGVTGELEVSEWEVATGKRTRHSPAPGKHSLVGVSPDLRYGLSVLRPDKNALGQLHLWDLTAGKSTRSWDERAGEWEAYAPDWHRHRERRRLRPLPGADLPPPGGESHSDRRAAE